MMTIADRLAALLDERRATIQLEKEYFTGQRPRLVLPDRTLPSYSAIVQQARSPWAELVISAAAERMKVTGFRVVTPDESDDDVEADGQAWDIWQHSRGDTWAPVGFTEMLLHGLSYALVEPGELPTITFESCESVATISAPGGRETVAAIKRWSEGDIDVAVIWTVEGAETMFRDRTKGLQQWETSATQLVENRTGMVPVFALRNRPDLMGGSDSDLTALYNTIDRATQSLADRITTQFFASTKVRYLLGVTPEVDADGNPAASTLSLATDKLLMIESPDAKAGVFDASDLRQFIEVAKSDISALAAIARLPTYLISGEMVNVSAEALNSLMQGLVSRVEQRQTWAAAALSDAMRLALSLAGDTRVNDPRTRVEPLWAEIVQPNISLTAAAASALVTAGIISPTGAQDIILGLTPSEREKLAGYQRVDALNQQGADLIAGLMAPQPPTASAAGEPVAEEEAPVG